MRLVKFRDHTDVKDIWVNADMVIYIEGESPADMYTMIHMAVPLQYPRSVGFLFMRQQRVDHDVAHKMDFFGRNALFFQVCFGALFGSEQKITHPVCQDAIDLLRHRHVKAS